MWRSREINEGKQPPATDKLTAPRVAEMDPCPWLKPLMSKRILLFQRGDTVCFAKYGGSRGFLSFCALVISHSRSSTTKEFRVSGSLGDVYDRAVFWT